MSYDEHLISMAGGDGDVTDRIAAIRKSNDTWLQSSVTDRNDRNTKFLLDLIEEQAAKLGRVEGVCGELFEFSKDASLTIGQRAAYRDASRAIRAAITATEASK